MSKYSAPKTGTKTVNKAGGVAFQESPQLEFVSTLLTTFLKNQYYRNEQGTSDRLVELIGKIDKKFAAKAAIFARNKFGMRSVSHLVAGEIAKQVKGEQWTKMFFDKIVYRPDDMVEILAYYYANVASNEPNALRKGFAKAFTRFDAYQLSKYKKEGHEVSLIDVANVVHPFHTKAVEGLIKGTLKPAETWETKMTQAGQKAENDEHKEELKKEVWVSLLKERKLGYFALLRNLRNIIQQAPELISLTCELLVDEGLIKKSLVLPFRFITAYQELQEERGAAKILAAISQALEISFANVPKLPGETLVVVDHSGSMGNGMSSNFMKGALFGIAMAKANNADFMHFGSLAKYLNFNPLDTTLTIAQWLDNQNSGRNFVNHGTDFYTIFEAASKRYDRIVIFSDMQGWGHGGAPTTELNTYKSKFDANPNIYSVNLCDQGTLMFPEANVYALAGWSEKIFDIMKLLEQDKQALIHEIERIEL